MLSGNKNVSYFEEIWTITTGAQLESNNIPTAQPVAKDTMVLPKRFFQRRVPTTIAVRLLPDERE